MNRLKELRQRCGLSMKEAAEKIGIPYTTYVNYEKSLREPNSEMLLKLAAFFGVTIDYLLCRTDTSYGYTSISEKEKSPPPAETDDELTQKIASDLYETLIRAGWCKPGEDITDQQRDILLAVIDILDATFRET